jgi:hypothetical protein
MNAADFRRIALSLEGAEEGSHMGSPDFRMRAAKRRKRGVPSEPALGSMGCNTAHGVRSGWS